MENVGMVMTGILAQRVENKACNKIHYGPHDEGFVKRATTKN